MKNACVILNYNDALTTKKLVESIKDYAAVDYIVIVDNNSNDNSLNILSTLTSNKVHLIISKTNGGYGYGNNRGFEYAYNELDAKYVAIVNPDVEFTETCYESLLNVLEDDPNCGAVAPISLNPNGTVSKSVAWRQTSILLETLMSSVILNRIFNHKTKYSDDYLFNAEHICKVDVIPGSFLLLNGKKFQSIGMYDENVFLYCEEKIIGWKFFEKNISTKLLTNESYIHSHSVTIDKNIKSHIKKTGIWLYSKKYFIEKYMLEHKRYAFLIILFFYYAKFESKLIGVAKKLRNKH